MGDGRSEIGDRRSEIGDRRSEIGDRRENRSQIPVKQSIQSWGC
jgi:hypothetical protein